MTTYLDSIDVCNVCLRVLRDERWVEAEDFIRETRSFDLPILPAFAPSVCPDCAVPTAEAA